MDHPSLAIALPSSVTHLIPSPIRQHAILKPFMLRRVKKDVVVEMTGKKEVRDGPCLLRPFLDTHAH